MEDAPKGSKETLRSPLVGKRLDFVSCQRDHMCDAGHGVRPLKVANPRLCKLVGRWPHAQTSPSAILSPSSGCSMAYSRSRWSDSGPNTVSQDCEANCWNDERSIPLGFQDPWALLARFHHQVWREICVHGQHPERQITGPD